MITRNNYNGVVPHLEPDILEYEVKWALALPQTKLVKVMKFKNLKDELFKNLKMMLLKCCTQYVSKFGKLSSGHRTGKGQFSFQSQRRANYRISVLISDATNVMLKILQVRFQQYMNGELPDISWI